MELSATAKVILGMVAMRPRTGYEIKSFVDNSTRFFWAASYGQIYPELKRLSEQGLIAGSDDPNGARKRIVYRLTPEGTRALAEWHEREAEVHEIRDEGLLKLFLAGAAGTDRATQVLAERAGHSARIAERLREVETSMAPSDLAAYTVLRFGIELNDWIEGWCEQAARDIESGKAEQAMRRSN